MSLFWFQFIVSAFLFWVGVYLVSRNIRSKTAWVIFFFLFSLSWYLLLVDAFSSFFASSYQLSKTLYYLSTWTYILPIPLLLHFSLLVSQNKIKIFWQILLIIYFCCFLLIALSIFSKLVIDYDQILSIDNEYGVYYGRGPLFTAIGVVAVIASSVSFRAYQIAYRDSRTNKYLLPTISSALYIISSPILVYLYHGDNYALAVYSTSPLLIGPAIFLLISVFFYGLISDIDGLFNIKEFIYLTVAVILISVVPGYLYVKYIPSLGTTGIVLGSCLLFLYILTHNFYDWLTTMLRDVIYRTGSLSLITDSEVADFVRNFHSPNNTEANSLLRFKYVKNQAKNGRVIDAAQETVREAIEYFKQSDYPRRTKQNLKYQMLKMLALDSAEEGQILWELGFDGYPMKILAGENQTRKPLFRIESMSDYTATSRNAFIALKKEAIHDLAWRLSYLEKNIKS